MTPLEGLDQACPVCGRRSGDHTLDEWAKCLGEPTTNLPFERIDDDAAKLAADRLREQFELDEDLIIADNVVVKAVTLSGMSGVVGVMVPGLVHEFGIGLPDKPAADVARVLYAGGPESLRAYGRLVRDSANGAANAAERAYG